MGFMTLNRYGDPSGTVFNPEDVVNQAKHTFDDTIVLPGDQLAISATRAAAMGAADHVVRTLRRNQQEFGPAFAFEISLDGAGTIQGCARLYDVTLLFPDPLPEKWRQRLLAFLQGLGPGRMEQSPDSVAMPA